MKKRLSKGVKLGAILALVALAIVFIGPLSATTVTHAAPGTKVPVPGANPVAANHGHKLGHKNGSDAIQLAVTLPYRNQGDLQTLLQNLYDPNSSMYHHFLKPQQFSDEFGPTQQQSDQVANFLRQSGLNVTSVSADHAVIDVVGTSAQVEKAFNVTLNNYQNNKGQVYYANEQAPQIPSELSGLVQSVTLNNEPLWHTHLNTNVTANVGSGPAGGYTPAELRGAYDVNPLISGGYTGSGQNVAVFELDGYVASNVSTYVSNYSLGSPAPKNVLVDSYNGSAGQGEVEVELDIEVINAIAPKAQVYVYEGPNSSAGVIDTYKKIATDNIVKVTSSSWGQCENESAQSDINSEDSIYQQMAAQGQSIFSAAGDTGAYDCRDQSTLLNVDNPADDPYVTGVGGTNLTITGSGSSAGYSSEHVWNDSASSAGGGGISTIFTKPSYQTGTGTTNSYSNGKRQVPDVTGNADPNSGYSIYSQGTWTVVGGTSAAAPLWAGIATLNNAYAAANGKSNLGQANPTLYRMFNTTQTYAAYHDITSGTNRYYPATTGYDQASGIGSPDAWNLIRDINSTSGGGGTPTPTPTPTQTPTPTPTQGGSSQLISNGGFESGSTGWTESSSGGYEIVDNSSSSLHHSGSASAWLCGYNSCNDAIYQSINVPSTANSVTLTFWVYVNTQESGSTAYDHFYARIRNTSGSTLATVKSLSNATASGWVQYSYSLNSYKGQTVQVYFNGTTDSSLPTNFFLDDVSVVAQ